MKLISASEAKAQGLKRYFTGKECLYGHIAERLVSNRACLQCQYESIEDQRALRPELSCAAQKKFRDTNDKERTRHLKQNHSPEDWDKHLSYFTVKNQERRQNAIGSLSSDIRETLFARQDGKCNGCTEELTESHIDHIFPLSRGGLNTDDNVQLLCPTCNLSKGSKTMQEWENVS